MKKAILFLTITASQLSLANICEFKMHRDLYGDLLLQEYDHALEKAVTLGAQFDSFSSESYRRLLALRSLQEEYGDPECPRYEKNLLLLTDVQKYNSMVNTVTRRMEAMENYLPQMNLQDSIIFPSNTTSGNVTGNQFPANTWSLTFDDGPRAETTPTVLENLKKHELQATFFVLTQKALPLIDLTLREKDEHRLALHSYSHLDLSKAGSQTLEREITQAKEELEREASVEIKLFRLPYGAGVSKSVVRDVITQNNLIHIFWNIDTLDWQDKNPDSIVKRALNEMKTTPHYSGVILFHDIHPQSVIASEKLMQILKDQKQKVCTVQAVIDAMNSGTECTQN